MSLNSACTPQQIALRGDRKPVNLALQGGGSHGAFTWGVLDRLLEDDRLALDAISATSAGAMNAAVMAYGMSRGGREGARQKLGQFWRAVSEAGSVLHPFGANPWGKMLGLMPWFSGPSPSYLWSQSINNFFSPYDLNPLDYNPLRDALVAVVDFDHLRQCPLATRLFICATNVRSGKIRVFENHELSADVILASACLPHIFKAVEIEGEAYWDGGYMGNPAIFPLIYRGASADVIIVHINPIRRDAVPRTAAAIRDRENEIAFNSSLMREMRAIAFVARLVDEERLDTNKYRRMLVHSIMDDAGMGLYDAESKLSADWAFLLELKEAGRQAAEAWLEANVAHIGKKTTAPIEQMYL